jgi:uncharacterized protein YjiS (DUF1127 family)
MKKLTEMAMRLAGLNIGEIYFHDQGQHRGGAVRERLGEAAAKLMIWRKRARERAELGRMDHFARQDIGVSEADVWREVRKAPWER